MSKLKIGDAVTINPESRHCNVADNQLPEGVVGKVSEIRPHLYNPYYVTWTHSGEEQRNAYQEEDLISSEAQISQISQVLESEDSTSIDFIAKIIDLCKLTGLQLTVNGEEVGVLLGTTNYKVKTFEELKEATDSYIRLSKFK